MEISPKGPFPDIMTFWSGLNISHLESMTPRSIVAALENGKMQIQGELLSIDEKIALAEFLAKRTYSKSTIERNRCNAPEQILSEVKYFGWGGNLAGTGFIDNSIAKLPKNEVGGLKLKWAFGIEGGTNSRIKPTVINDKIIFGSQFGEVYCTDMVSGCTVWSFDADANIRGGIAVSDDIEREGRVYFADFTGNIYALRANNGGLIWKKSIKNEPESAVTGTPTYYNSLLYIPMSSMESNTAVLLSYECCKNSGQIVALKGLSGKEAWRHRIINGKATEKGLNSAGIKKYGPSGSAIWSSPTIDAKRGLLYIGTGQNYSNTPTTISDARQALDLMTGELRWNYQATSKDVFVRLCPNPDNPNCEDASGPDLDFGIAPILVTRNDGKEVLLSGQKSGVVHCLNPDDGRLIWKKRIGRGGAMGGIHWGIATDVNRVFVPNSDMFEVGSDSEYPASSGLYALDLMSGEVEWKSSSDPNVCESKPGCYNSYSAAPSVIQGVVFAGSLDGHARAYDSDTGEVLWDFDTYREFETINKVDANGGSIDGPGPVIINGMVFFSSGYSIAGQMLGNVLLAFSDE